MLVDLTIKIGKRYAERPLSPGAKPTRHVSVLWFLSQGDLTEEDTGNQVDKMTRSGLSLLQRYKWKPHTTETLTDTESSTVDYREKGGEEGRRDRRVKPQGTEETRLWRVSTQRGQTSPYKLSTWRLCNINQRYPNPFHSKNLKDL